MPVPKGFKRQKRPYRDYDQTQLFAGILVEMEHTDDWETAKRIAAIHLDEREDYYILLDKHVESAPRRNPSAAKVRWLLEPTESGTCLQTWKDWEIRHDGPDALWEVRYQGKHEVWAGDAATARRLAVALIDTKKPRRNPPASLDSRTEAAYRRFHGAEPTQVQDRRGVVGGTFHELGRGVDVGYAGPKGTKTKTGRFVHDFKTGVVILRRGDGPKAVSLNPPATKTLNVAGRFLGITYRDAAGKEHELAGGAGQQLCWDPHDPQTAYVVDSKGIRYVIAGGYFRVDDWLYN